MSALTAEQERELRAIAQDFPGWVGWIDLAGRYHCRLANSTSPLIVSAGSAAGLRGKIPPDWWIEYILEFRRWHVWQAPDGSGFYAWLFGASPTVKRHGDTPEALAEAIRATPVRVPEPW
jgi:hypothetical protein